MARILVVDDSETFREIIKEILISEGHAIVGEAANGSEGVQRYKELSPDITTMDITMPVMNGIEALRAIIEFDPKAKVIMVSSSAQNRKIAESIIMGAYGFLAKPFDQEKVAKFICEIATSADE